ncbi:hypothetical protein LCGC14_0251560 [marine sediment metagenome]|uniref:Peptidase S74 domain-containing protein n=1 Tax=marine sediment metagenome TaxID=412755 RepID=A0A0F9U900_9ZZZZ
MSQGFAQQFGVSFDAGALTGATLAANVVNSSLENLGTLIGLFFESGAVIDWDAADITLTHSAGRLAMSGGTLELNYTADANDIHAVELNVDVAGFGDVNAFHIAYKTGAISTGEDEAVILLSVDESLAAGGDITGFEMLSTAGSAAVHAIGAGVGVAPIKHQSGVFGNMDSALVNAVDRLAEFTSTGSDIQMFVADNDTVTIGDAAKFQELEFLLAIVASGAGIAPVFEFSTGVGTWASFSPTDGTAGMRDSGVIAWEDSDIPGWVVGTGGEYLIRITRTRNTLSTPPTEDLVQISAVTEFSWDKDGNVSINNLTLAASKRLYLDGGDNTYFQEVADNQINVVADGTAVMAWKPTEAIFGGGIDVKIAATKKLYLDGGGDSYIHEDTTNRILIVAGGTPTAYFTGRDVYLTPTGKLYLDGGGNTYIFEQAGDVLQCVSGGSGGVKLTSGATSWASVSDERIKTIIEPISDALAGVNRLRSVIGRFKDDDISRRRSFLIAQDVQKVLPEAVTEGEDGILNLSYTDVIPLLVAAINELKVKVEDLKLDKAA